jgi:hypothetical protein
MRWTRKATRSIAEELLTLGIQVSANTVRRLLRQMQLSLRTNRKNIESGIKRKHGDRDRRNRQFIVINAKRRRFETADLPIISVDGKKRELVGNFKNGGDFARNPGFCRRRHRTVVAQQRQETLR